MQGVPSLKTVHRTVLKFTPCGAPFGIWEFRRLRTATMRGLCPLPDLTRQGLTPPLDPASTYTKYDNYQLSIVFKILYKVFDYLTEVGVLIHSFGYLLIMDSHSRMVLTEHIAYLDISHTLYFFQNIDSDFSCE